MADNKIITSKKQKLGKRARKTSTGRGPFHIQNGEPSSKVKSTTDVPVAVVEKPEFQNPLFPIVGIGASAGGLDAMRRLLRALPTNTGMSFVIVQHLSPSRESALSEILSRETSMHITEVSDQPELEPNRVYVIPPDKAMVMSNGHLELLPRKPEGKHHPIDQFFSSLAKNCRHMAIGIVLSGTANDGTLGLEEIKAEGGITFAQDDTAEHKGMPESAVSSGVVDFVLAPEGIATELVRIAQHPYVKTPSEVDADSATSARDKTEIQPILKLLQNDTGVDFMEYKLQTLSRRISRRMLLAKKTTLNEYARFLRDTPREAQALYHDVLINVTSFFRDPGMFETLRSKIIPELLNERAWDEPLRVWVLGCSTGEEAYSLAMALTEARESSALFASRNTSPAQVFATDLNATGIEHCRRGIYSKARLKDVSPERLRRFFTENNGDYRVSKAIRDMCVFSRHNVMSDPPFSRMDLISCRNLLIYLEPTLQQKILPLLHYALKPNGFLVLGSSETVGRAFELFKIEDQKHKIFSKKSITVRRISFPLQGSLTNSSPPSSDKSRAFPPNTATARLAAAFDQTNVHKASERVLLSLLPPSVLVDTYFNILEFRGNTKPYLSLAEGKASLSLLRLARQELVVPLRALLQRAKKENTPSKKENVRIRGKEGNLMVNLEVLPVSGSRGDEQSFLVLFKETFEKEAGLRTTSSKKKQTLLKNRRHQKSDYASEKLSQNTFLLLENELEGCRDHINSLSEQHDAAIEELQSVNEEAQSANEELQSINEELETSKEEIQSSNEELTTVNDELHNRNLELGVLTNDLTNLINSIHVAIIIVGRDLRIRRFSPMAERLLSIIPSDVGRSVIDIRMKLRLPNLEALLIEVVDSITPMDLEVQATDGRWYSLRLRPYLTVENKIDGAVLSLIDIDNIRRAREYAERIIETVREPLVVLDSKLRVRSASRAFYETFLITPEETEDNLIFELGNKQWDIPGLRRALEEILPSQNSFNDFEVEHTFVSLGRRVMLLNARKFRLDDAVDDSLILLAIEDVTERKEIERERHERENDLARFNNAAVGRELRMIELKKEVNALCKKQGEAEPYQLEFEQRSDETTDPTCEPMELRGIQDKREGG